MFWPLDDGVLPPGTGWRSEVSRDVKKNAGIYRAQSSKKWARMGFGVSFFPMDRQHGRVSFPATKLSMAVIYSTVWYPRARRFTAENRLLSPSMKAVVRPRVQWAKILSKFSIVQACARHRLELIPG